MSGGSDGEYCDYAVFGRDHFCTSVEVDEDDVSDDLFYSLYRAYGRDLYGVEIWYIRYGRRIIEQDRRDIRDCAEELVPDYMANAAADHHIYFVGGYRVQCGALYGRA